MKKKKKISKSKRFEKMIYKTFIFTSIILVIGIIYSKAMMGKINLEIQELNNQVKEETEDNQSLTMKINEMISLDKIQEVSDELGLKFNNDNIKTVIE